MDARDRLVVELEADVRRTCMAALSEQNPLSMDEQLVDVAIKSSGIELPFPCATPLEIPTHLL